MAKWRRMTTKELELEYQLEIVNKGMVGKIVPDLKSFISLYKKSKDKKITKAVDMGISYRSHTKSREQLRGLISSYRSWPEFRNDKTLDRLYSGVENDEVIPMPIIIKSGKNMRILSGNTRADVAMQIDGNYKAIIMEY